MDELLKKLASIRFEDLRQHYTAMLRAQHRNVKMPVLVSLAEFNDLLTQNTAQLSVEQADVYDAEKLKNLMSKVEMISAIYQLEERGGLNQPIHNIYWSVSARVKLNEDEKTELRYHGYQLERDIEDLQNKISLENKNDNASLKKLVRNILMHVNKLELPIDTATGNFNKITKLINDLNSALGVDYSTQDEDVKHHMIDFLKELMPDSIGVDSSALPDKFDAIVDQLHAENNQAYRFVLAIHNAFNQKVEEMQKLRAKRDEAKRVAAVNNLIKICDEYKKHLEDQIAADRPAVSQFLLGRVDLMEKQMRKERQLAGNDEEAYTLDLRIRGLPNLRALFKQQTCTKEDLLRQHLQEVNVSEQQKPAVVRRVEAANKKLSIVASMLEELKSEKSSQDKLNGFATQYKANRSMLAKSRVDAFAKRFLRIVGTILAGLSVVGIFLLPKLWETKGESMVEDVDITLKRRPR